jgi:hypothetical protein
MANTVWAFATAAAPAPSLFNAVAVSEASGGLHDLTTENLCQLHQWQLWLDLSNQRCGTNVLSAEMLQRCREAMQRAETHASQLLLNVGAMLAHAFPSPEAAFADEHIEERTGYSIDLALPSVRLGIEVDGPSHFIRQDRDALNGSTMLKQRLLRLAGWRIISVPYFEWDELEDSTAKVSYLTQLIGLLPPPVDGANAAEPLPLIEQVRAAITTYALDEGRLANIFDTHALAWDEARGRKIVDMAVAKIGESVRSRGETTYALNGNATRIASVERYLNKVVARYAAQS